MSIEFSVDRLAGVVEFIDISYPVDIDDILNIIYESFQNEKSLANDSKYTFDIKQGTGWFSFRLVDSQTLESEQLLNVAKLKYDDYRVRFDWNPKRMRDLSWAYIALKSALDTISVSKNNRGSVVKKLADFHYTQVDIAIDLKNEKDAEVMDIMKLGSTRSHIFSDRSGALQTEYVSKRQSTTYAKKYNKFDERVKKINAKYARLRYVQQERVRDARRSNLSEDLVQSISSDVAQELDILSSERILEIEQLEPNWWRFEFTLRTKKFKSKLIFDDNEVLDWIKRFGIRDWTTISDPMLRMFVIGIQDGVARKKDLPKIWQTRINQIMKYDDIATWRDDNNNTHTTAIEKVPSGANITYRAIKNSNYDLPNRIKEKFEFVRSDLLDEVSAYFD